MRELKYQAEKEARLKINLENIISKEYHNFVNVLSKKNSNTIFFHQKFDYKIILEKYQKYSFTPPYNMSS